METEPLANPDKTGTGAADEFGRKEDRKQCKKKKKDRDHELAKPMLQFFPEFEKTGPTPFPSNMF